LANPFSTSFKANIFSEIRIRKKLAMKIIGGLIMGISASWWKERHFQHHIYTNRENKDPEINNMYPAFTYPFSLAKWSL